MRPLLTEVQLLENYLKGTLPEDQQLDVEIRLLWDQDVQQKLANQQLAYKTLRLFGRRQLRAELEAIHVRLFG
ncbi:MULTISPECIES: hypothetical protein [unclassified Spirosoma]|uniref:hypothetical protein n=1 Tax=unclassified Spirosoma TaxID=2621999 RepID=UPI00095E097E|nr:MULTISPECIES: hypothetical protein [unclassified Spirosoma]MBN8822850.1 hypothetical protein [Spirosoma sp.]OJW80046.1 MAG: hypothetical protein BGO59_02225 [Spirosoma sp. 48-14]